MALTIQQSFLGFKTNLEITNLQASTVSARQARVRESLEASLEIQSSFLTGSYSRNTMIAPLKEADVDIFVVTDVKYYHNYNTQNGGQAGLLDLVKRTLRRTYPDTPDISRSGQAVTIRFTDFVVDVVPGFHRTGGGYLIPNSITQTWLATDPKRHVELVSQSNGNHNGTLVPLIKMIKAWNRENGRFFRSFHLEVLALEVFRNVTITDYPSGARYFFDKALMLVPGKNLDPAGYGDDVGKYINSREKLDEAIAKLQRAHERALNAEAFATRGNISAAVERWRMIFGSNFPTYG